MLPRLDAEEQMARATAAALGAGTMKREDAGRVLSRLERQAAGATSPRADPSTAAGRAVLSAIGIKVEEPGTPASNPPPTAES